MASPCIASLFSAASALPAGVGAPHQQRQPRRLVVAAAAKRRYKGTARREAALAELVERKVAEAMEACAGREAEARCRVAWDEVEEVSQARADLRRRIAEAPGDPLEPFCAHNPDDDDCAVVYVDD
ncbi:calvin cycle protein CP12-3, chloroplastic-like [Panicum miliaceum]|uniref:Calvin cycle protein CP12-3, chloroplastic-like n=1 Tax=Panicum miliaceum TaxID=4540 RepID=A0A3L6RN98_PANMI|nr:calvin cycle protein CP12-3, chloroplastic-like [Panicum miliaceum]